MRFTVRGNYPFPTDMLRRDQCYPATEQDAVTLRELCENARSPDRDISLISGHGAGPSVKAWESFCWVVVAIGRVAEAA